MNLAEDVCRVSLVAHNRTVTVLSTSWHKPPCDDVWQRNPSMCGATGIADAVSRLHTVALSGTQYDRPVANREVTINLCMARAAAGIEHVDIKPCASSGMSSHLKVIGKGRRFRTINIM